MSFEDSGRTTIYTSPVDGSCDPPCPIASDRKINRFKQAAITAHYSTGSLEQLKVGF